MKNELVVKLIKSYQKNKQIIGVGHCKFYPTCSEYALQTYQKFNFFYASLLVGIRILRCNPLAKRRPYPVKLTKKEKADIKFINSLKNDFDNDFIDYVLSVNQIKDLTENDFYNYISDYYFLPNHPTSSVSTNDDLVFGSRYIITNDKPRTTYNISSSNLFEVYLSYVEKLYNYGLIKVMPKAGLQKQNPNLYLIPIDALSLEDILEKENLETGIIVVNNYNQDIKYRDFEIIRLLKPKDFKDLIKNKTKVLILTTDFEIFPYLHDIDFSINCFDQPSDINYFYNLNKKKL